MKKLKKYNLVLLLFITLGCNNLYYKEMNRIVESLNSIDNIEVLDIWGNYDISVEEISARIKIYKKGEIVLTDLSRDLFNYPESVNVSEINNYSFRILQDNISQVSFDLDIGSASSVGKMLMVDFNNPEDVIIHYDKILSLIDSLPHYPDDFKYFKIKNSDTLFYTATIILKTN